MLMVFGYSISLYNLFGKPKNRLNPTKNNENATPSGTWLRPSEMNGKINKDSGQEEPAGIRNLFDC
jgi:hypothetical protein